MKVYLIGAGPGDPELLTIKAKKKIEEADQIVYAGSLINPEILNINKRAEKFDSSGLSLNDVVSIYLEAKKHKLNVARLQCGDLSFYSTIGEQILKLKEAGIEYEIIPGVGSMAASTSALARELTLPDISQTVIISRLEGRTPVPDSEKLSRLAEHRATLCLYLSVHMIDRVVEILIPAYGPMTGAAVVEKASWPDQQIIEGKLEDLADLVKAAQIEKTALIIVGDVLRGRGSLSKLYDRDFAHGYRK